jgi:hypothetical protein
MPAVKSRYRAVRDGAMSSAVYQVQLYLRVVQGSAPWLGPEERVKLAQAVAFMTRPVMSSCNMDEASLKAFNAAVGRKAA